MIQTNVRFTTTNKKLNQLYESAKNTLFSSIANFGERKLVTDAPNSNITTLHYSPMSAETLADYDIEIAMDTVNAFLLTLRKDGRLPSSLSQTNGEIFPAYESLTGFSFVEEALKLAYLAKNKNSPYTKRLYETLCHFDEYLWTKHDLNANGGLEIFEEKETEEGLSSERFPATTTLQNGTARSLSPFPVESFDLTAEAFCVRKTLAELAFLLGKQEAAKSWQEKANAIAEKINSFFWLEDFHACFDRDYRGNAIHTLSINNLFLLYFDAVDATMAKAIIQNHILNPDEFWTPIPLPTLAKDNSHFDNHKEFCGPPRGTTYRRAIRAFEKYGYYSLTTEVGQKLLSATAGQNIFPVCFDPITGEPLNADKLSAYAPTASAVLETIKRFFGVYTDRETVCWGCLGQENAETEYTFTWGNDTYSLETEDGISTGSINGTRIFTVTAGTRIFTDIHGSSMRIANATASEIDCICVCRDRTFSLHLDPNEIKDITNS